MLCSTTIPGARCVLALGCLLIAAPLLADDDAVQFNRDIRPLLSNACYTCHGPDSTQRKADLRLDKKAGLFEKRDDVTLVVPGKPKLSELLRRMTSDDSDVRMPPPKSGRTLTPKQIALIKRWIEQGATWQPHWAFIPPKRPKLPAVKNRNRIRNAIDAFVLAKLETKGRSLSPDAQKTTLLRRVTLDLTGLPPTLQEIDAFLADKSPRAYENVVDRLLKSPHFGEKMSVHWLDAARYADTSGYQNDGPRSMWRWRDWVIASFNANKPFDRFALEQLAGDMLPGATLDQKIATAFNRNHRGNAEGGIIPEEFQVEYVVDRVETTFTVFQGLTMGCARCHDHKFDPFSQKEFYRAFAYFNNIPENGRAVKEGNSPPFIKAPTKAQRQQLSELQQKLNAAERRFRELKPAILLAQKRWEKRLAGKDVDWTIADGLEAHFPLNGNVNNAVKNAKDRTKPDGESKTKKRETLRFAKGMLDGAVDLEGSSALSVGDIGDFGYFDKFSFGAWVFPTAKHEGTIFSRMTDVEHGDGYSLVMTKAGALQVNLVKRWLDDSIRIETKTANPTDRWSHVFVTYDGSRVAKGIRVYINGQPVEVIVHHDFLNQTMRSKEPFRIGAGGGPSNRFRGRIDDVRIYDRALSAKETRIVSVPQSVSEIVGIPIAKRTDAQREKVRDCFLNRFAEKRLQTANRLVLKLRARKAALVESLPTVMVMQEMKTPRPTFVLKRGEYDKHGQPVTPGVPASLSVDAKKSPANRLAFSRWIISRQNPLTARVTVNRFWEMLFGTGIVKTAEDFGSQGERPSHPELLDWLAVEFMESGWNVKSLLKTIVMSSTYRQSSGPPMPSDPENRLLSHGPRFRLSAETIRDQALAVSGLLTKTIGGPSVRPYQPDGLWKEIATDGDYVQSHGANLYRRSLYTYWKRTVSPPVMAAFDASDREFCRVRRSRTNTPLQALALLNEVSFVEAARVLAERMMTAGGTTAEDRITFAFRSATSRKPRAAELRILVAGFQAHRAKYRKDRKAAEQLVATGESPRHKTLDTADLAAYTAIASVILNLDEVLTKE